DEIRVLLMRERHALLAVRRRQRLETPGIGRRREPLRKGLVGIDEQDALGHDAFGKDYGSRSRGSTNRAGALQNYRSSTACTSCRTSLSSRSEMREYTISSVLQETTLYPRRSEERRVGIECS